MTRCLKTRILKGNDGKVDFDGPLVITPEQKERIIAFFKREFNPVEIVEEVTDFRAKRLGDKARFSVHWTRAEYRELLRPENNEYLADKMGRNWMSIIMKQMSFQPSLMDFAQRKGTTEDTVRSEHIEEFLDEYLKGKEQAKEARKSRTPALYCRPCDRHYNPSRLAKNGISLPRTCDFCGAALDEEYVKRTELDDLTKRGKYAERYDSVTGKPL